MRCLKGTIYFSIYRDIKQKNKSSHSYHNGKTRTVCYLLWPDGKYPLSVADYLYNIVFLILTYGIPMLVMVVCYTLMGKELWGSQSIGEHTERQKESVKSKKKVKDFN